MHQSTKMILAGQSISSKIALVFEHLSGMFSKSCRMKPAFVEPSDVLQSAF